MEPDDLFPKAPGDPVHLLAKQDLDPFSVEELKARIAALQAEIARSEAKIQFAVGHRSLAEGLFKR